MTTFKALLVCPKTKTITPILMDEENQLDQFYKHIDCRIVEALEFPNGDTAWIDEEGLFVQDQQFFHLPSLLPQPLAGSCVITGTAWDDDSDKLADCKSTVEELMAEIQWLDRNQLLASGFI